MQPGEKNTDFMQKVNPKELKSMDLMFLKRAEEINLERALRYKKLRKSNAILGLSLAATVLGIYFYTMHAVKQETFLDDLNEPETISKESIAN
ncbi:cytochrome c oxidase assembly factor 3, mitochondrial-like [Andrena cerasifolii]|uniref:cytochrome c oxidase assembly factor 3, mitochondrial-like n=1 Tax=Andrena cerasifolii TaxID=2819439 RepID=UPI0040383E3A